MSTCIRPRKDGGSSECSSPDELVGRGRCCHVIGDDSSNQCKMEMFKIQRGMYEVKVDESTITIAAQKEVIIKFFNEMVTLDMDKQKKIIEFLEKEG